jgi:hypothetical protein
MPSRATRLAASRQKRSPHEVSTAVPTVRWRCFAVPYSQSYKVDSTNLKPTDYSPLR